MPLPHPLHCRSAAWAQLVGQLPTLGTTEGLLRAACAVATHELDPAAAEADAVVARVEELANRVRARVASDRPRALLAHAHEVLFEEERFRGTEPGEASPHSSYLPMVLKTRRGLPVTLSLIYKAVLERVGVDVCGLNTPGHFLAGISGIDEEPGRLMIVDVADAGRVLSQEQAFRRIEQAAGTAVPRQRGLLAEATHRQWLIRLLQNLIMVFDRAGRWPDQAAMLELRTLVETPQR
ncbi:MAG: transglutaminase-like domain-containing protein [Phycisphaeraceae bacterium]